MAVSNTLQKKATQKTSQMVRFEVNGAIVEISPQIVRDYLVSGDKERVTMQELVMFINLCKFNGLNPWLREAYLVKYGSEPATMVTGKEAFEKRADNNPDYDGNKAGVIVVRPDNDEPVYRVGALVLPDETLVGGWAEVWRKERKQTCRIEVGFDEYAGRKKDGSLNRQWAAKPATMIRKVALVQALRESFPKSFQGMFTSEEQNVDDSVIDLQPVEPPVEASATPAGELNAPDIIANTTGDDSVDPASSFFNQ